LQFIVKEGEDSHVVGKVAFDPKNTVDASVYIGLAKELGL
jgi:hypothetical protein